MRNRVEPGEIIAAIHEDDASGSRVDEAVFRRLAEQHGVPPHLIDPMCASLSAGASAYRHARSMESADQRQPLHPDVRRELDRVLMLTEELESKLEHLSDEARAYFDSVEWDVMLQMLGGTREASSFGHRFYRGWGQDGQGMTHLQHLPEIIATITVLKNMTKHILPIAEEPADQGGRPRNEAMPLWVNNFTPFGRKRSVSGLLLTNTRESRPALQPPFAGTHFS
jgi:hypothetical protein